MPGKILVVEDNFDFRQILISILRPLGHEIIQAQTAQECIDKAIRDPPDLIIMDLGLVGLNGIEATRLLKQHPRTAAITVIAYTVWGDEFRGRAMAAGIAEFPPKSTPLRVVGQVIEKFLQRTGTP